MRFVPNGSILDATDPGGMIRFVSPSRWDLGTLIGSALILISSLVL